MDAEHDAPEAEQTRAGIPDRGLDPRRTGLWGGFLDNLPVAEAVRMVQEFEAAGVGTLFLPEFRGADPFVRSALYLSATTHLRISLGVATIYARDPEAMVAASATLEDAFPGRFVLGMGVSHKALVEARGHVFGPPLKTMRDYLAAMDATAKGRKLPPRILAALGPKMTELAAEAADGVHTYFCPVEHTARSRELLGPDRWLAPALMVSVAPEGGDELREYMRFCLSLPNYTSNLERFGYTEEDFRTASDRLVDALVAPADPQRLGKQIDAHLDAGADLVVLQLVPPPAAQVVRDRVVGGLMDTGSSRGPAA
jgi:probable F420-dependent oxidoreductase